MVDFKELINSIRKENITLFIGSGFSLKAGAPSAYSLVNAINNTLPEDEKIDGIMSFAVDPGVVTAAYVAEQLNLPHSGTYKSILILQNKHLFRKFLEDNGFNVPKSKG